MAVANILAYVEPDMKEQAEAIMEQLGVPVSAVINMLYKQIVITQSIPFPHPEIPMSRAEMDGAAFDEMMQRGLDDAKEDRARPAAEVFSDLRRKIQEMR